MNESTVQPPTDRSPVFPPIPEVPDRPEAQRKPERCIRCAYSLEGLEIGGVCPECAQPIEALPSVIDFPANCVKCDYSLQGLAFGGVCPECGTAIDRSIHNNPLRLSDLEYLKKLRWGVSLVLNGILLAIINAVLGVVVLAAVTGSGATAGTVAGAQLLVSALSLAVSLMILYGWWLLSEPDPKFVGASDASQSRSVVRVLVVIAAVFTAVQTVSQLLFTAGTTNTMLDMLFAMTGFGALVLFVVRFFAEMQYVKWLAVRVPNMKVYKRAKTLMWLGPVLYTFGLLLLGLGPLIALVLYWNMLHWLRKDIKAIVAQREQTSPAVV